MINILLVEDHKLVRNGIKMLLESDENLHVIAEANNGESAWEKISEGLSVDLIITDINLDGMDGMMLTKQVKVAYPDIKVIVLSMLNDVEYIAESFDNGAQAYIIKTSDYSELLFAIPHVMGGGKYICESIMLHLLEIAKETKNIENQQIVSITNLELTERETEILYLISDGFTNNEIADKLFLSKRTVEGHRQNLIDKTQVRNSAQLVKYAAKNGLI